MSTVETTKPIILARRVEEDASVTEWEKKTKIFKRDASSWSLLLFIPLSIPLTLAAIFLIQHLLTASTHGSVFENNPKGFWIVMSISLMLSILISFSGVITTDMEVKKSRWERGRIKRTRRVAGRVGSEVVQILTKTHVEYLNKINDALDHKRQEKGGPKRVSDTDAIAVLLFEDLSRMPIILSLIEDRGMLTAAEISMALDDIETRPAALWEGAL